mmetsp:Transcript_7242/g.6361  ORF Transcript_7242/g.6361 Transcript_7242/m.6361 type:complete len:115 (+) Transcript_7242:2-346(+)
MDQDSQSKGTFHSFNNPLLSKSNQKVYYDHKSIIKDESFDDYSSNNLMEKYLKKKQSEENYSMRAALQKVKMVDPNLSEHQYNFVTARKSNLFHKPLNKSSQRYSKKPLNQDIS